MWAVLVPIERQLLLRYIVGDFCYFFVVALLLFHTSFVALFTYFATEHEIRISGEGNPKGDLQTLFLTLVLAEPENTWKIDTFATQFVTPEAYAGSMPSTFYSFSADRNYYDALVVIGKHYTLFNQGLYEQAYQFYSPSAQIPNLKTSKEYVASIQLFKIKVERVIGIYPIYKPARELWCATPDAGTNGLDFGIGLYEEGENGNVGALSNGIHHPVIHRSIIRSFSIFHMTFLTLTIASNSYRIIDSTTQTSQSQKS